MNVIKSSHGIKGCSFSQYWPNREVKLELNKGFKVLKQYTKLELVANGIKRYYHSCHGNGTFIALDKI